MHADWFDLLKHRFLLKCLEGLLVKKKCQKKLFPKYVWKVCPNTIDSWIYLNYLITILKAVIDEI